MYIEKLNGYANLLSLGASCILAFLTWRYVKAANRQVLLTNEILKASEKATIDQTRPYVIVTLPAINTYFFLAVKNIGKRSAHDIVIKIEPPLDDLAQGLTDDSFHAPMLNQKFMAPGYEYKAIINKNEKVVKITKEQSVRKIKVSYKDYDERPYSEDYEIDILNYLFPHKVREYDSDYYREMIHRSLDKVEMTLKDIKNEISDLQPVNSDVLENGVELERKENENG